jgi:phosphoribosyl 1,2-cyclic phosphodiesterase
MDIIVLASGSGGNVTYLEQGGTKLLIDCGISYRQIGTRLAKVGRNLEDLSGVLITHEHSDHIKGLEMLMKRHDATVYLTANTYHGLSKAVQESLPASRTTFVQSYDTLWHDALRITPLSVSHDASDAVGYVIEAEDKKLVYITDIGYLPKRDHDLLRDADMYIFESNYDVTMLFTSNRPFYLKQRIDSVKGHMSNTDSAYHLAQLIGPSTRRIVLAHRSRECNTDELVLTTYHDVFAEYGLHLSDYEVIVASQDHPTPLFQL